MYKKKFITFVIDFLLYSIAVNISSGAIYVKSELDYETNPSLKVAVFAFDSSSLTAQNKGETMVEITLTDINDNAPQITNLPSEVTITENRVNMNLFTLNVSVNLFFIN